MGARWMLAAALVVPALAQAQESVKPEVILLLESSADMEFPLDGRPVVCSPEGTVLPELIEYHSATANNIVKEALVGDVRTFDNAPAKWCVTQDAAHRALWHALGADGATPHHRQMCCSEPMGGICTGFAPCGDDHGRGVVRRDGLLTGVNIAWQPNGVIQTYLEDVKFALLSSDGSPDPRDDVRGHFSYGNEDIRGPDGAIINMGVRRTGVWNGGMFPGGLADLHDDGFLHWDAFVDETPRDVRRHNALMMYNIRRIVPFGIAPISAMIRDTVQYLEGQAASDGKFQCRKRVAVLITRGKETALYGGQDCPCDADSQCVEGRCYYPAGYPYQTGESYAAELLDQGVPLHVVVLDEEGGLGHLRAQSIAASGAPTHGPGGGAGVYRVDSVAGLRKAMTRITRSALTGRRARTTPLVISSTQADYCQPGQLPCARPDDAVVQWRLSAYSEIDGGGVYGRLDGTEMSCDPEGLENGRPGAPRPTRTPKLYHEVFAAQEGARRTVATNPNADGAVFSVSGGQQDMFNVWGGLDGAFNAAEVDAMTGQDADPLQNGLDGVAALPDHEPAGQLAMGLKLSGYFGDRGLPEDRAAATRQLGGFIQGDVIALQAPALGLTTPSYLAYVIAQKSRPTMVLTGARDGMLHVFRAKDGREIFNVVPRASWARLNEAETPVDGPLDAADVVPCRTIGEGGDANCPSDPGDWKFEAWAVGGAGEAGENIYGVNMTKAITLAAEIERDLNVADDFGAAGVWDITPDDVADPAQPAALPGLSVSRPVITHVRVNDQVRAAAVTGCGEDPFGEQSGLPLSDAPGRCVLVLDVKTGAVIRRFDFNDNVQMLYPFTGSPVAYPAGGVAPASRVYIGDRAGRLWRLNMLATDPANWSAAVAWPPGLDGGQFDQDAAGGYELGRSVVDRPSLSLRSDGGLVVVFGTGEKVVSNGTVKSFAVSFTDRAVVDADGDVGFQVTRNWVMELGVGERMTGAAVTRNEVSYFTTRQDVPAAADCEGVRGRLYGVHFFKRYVDAAGDPATFQAAGGRQLDVVPALPQFAADGTPLGEKGLSIILPPGRVAYGVALARTPSCAEGQAATTDLVLNLADESAGGSAGIEGEAAAGSSKVEVVQNNVVQERPLAGKVFARGSGVQFELCLDCTPDGQPAAGLEGPGLAPFPTAVAYWGSTFLQ